MLEYGELQFVGVDLLGQREVTENFESLQTEHKNSMYVQVLSLHLLRYLKSISRTDRNHVLKRADRSEVPA